jgi:hydroxymethyl cephem carbamoyltransferase
MRIVAINKEHDGAVAIVDNCRLIKCIEAQKDNHVRHAQLTEDLLQFALEALSEEGSIFAIGGWFNNGGYLGTGSSAITVQRVTQKGREHLRFTTSHERAHVFCAYGLSPFEQGCPCYVLVWEGTLGNFYIVSEHCEIELLCTPMVQPGHRYAFLYELANPTFPESARGWSNEVSGRLMALASRCDSEPLHQHERNLMDLLLNRFHSSHTRKWQLRNSPFWNCGCTEENFRRFAHKFSAALFDRFFSSIKPLVKRRLPLLIVGGCGLNCDWNCRWLDSGLFADVFVPPCTDDSGIAIGVAVDAQRHFSGIAKLEWTVYSGAAFEYDISVDDRFSASELNFATISDLLLDGAVIAWVTGRYEIGPRALGNRSLLAAPFREEMKDRLNSIKGRENYRPIAPICMEEQAPQWFDWHGPSPHMLYFQRVLSEQLRAVTHDDGTARVQTLNAGDHPQLYRLLCEFSRRSGFGVLCNTSLNFPGRGFINRMSDLARFVEEKGLDAMVVEDRVYFPKMRS